MVFLYFVVRFFSEFAASVLLVLIDHISAVGSAKASSSRELCILYGLTVMVLLHCLCFSAGGFGNPLVKLTHCMGGRLSPEMFIVLSTAEVFGAFVGQYLVAMDATGMVETHTTIKLRSQGAAGYAQFWTVACTALVIMAWCLYDEFRQLFKRHVWCHLAFLAVAYTLHQRANLGEVTNPVRLLAKSVFVNKFDNFFILFAGQLTAFIVNAVPYGKILFRTGIDVVALVRASGDRLHLFERFN